MIPQKSSTQKICRAFRRDPNFIERDRFLKTLKPLQDLHQSNYGYIILTYNDYCRELIRSLLSEVHPSFHLEADHNYVEFIASLLKDKYGIRST